MTDHPAKYSPKVLQTISNMLGQPRKGSNKILDPFAGTGLIHSLRPTWHTIGVEIEQEWAALSPHTVHEDALIFLGYTPDEWYDAIVTSPCFGNRMADHHDAKDSSKRITYRHMLGRALSAGSAAGMPWGNRYRDFHSEIWTECARVLKPGGDFILHISDHIRKGEVQPVSQWHRDVLVKEGLKFIEGLEITSRRMRFGANRELRVVSEYVYHFKK
jgi:DNA modification methylase